MAYVKTFNREQEIAILTRIAEQTDSIASKQSGLTRAQNHLKAERAVLEALKKELFVCRFGQHVLDARRANAAKARAEKASKKTIALEKKIAESVALPAAVSAIASMISPPATPAAHPLIPDITARINRPEPQAPEGPVEHRCDRCNRTISTRGLCGCVGVRHRNLRQIQLGPKLNIKHPPVPAFQLGAEKV